MRVRRIVPALLLAMAAVPVAAGNSLVPAGAPVTVAKSALTVTPAREWNRLGGRPGRDAESWTLDGDGLNDLTFYGGIETDHPLFREVNRKGKPLPRFMAGMLLTDLPPLLENSYRIALDTPLMTIEAIEPATLAGHKAVRFRYRFTRQDEEVMRLGEGVAAIVGGRLYMMTFEAPALYYFDRDIASVRALMASATLPA